MDFSAAFEIISNEYYAENQWRVVGNVIDKTGNFFAFNVQVNDVVYMNAAMFGMGIMRYKVVAIEDNNGVSITCILKYDGNPEDSILEPYAGFPCIIGNANKLGLVSIPSYTVNSIEESFITAVQNYEKNNILNKAILQTESPEFQGKPLTPTPDDISDDGQIANTEWVNNQIRKGFLKKYIAGEDLAPYKVVYLGEDKKVYLATSYNVNCANNIIGITRENKKMSEEILIQKTGEVVNEAWNFENIGDPVFVNEDGDTSLIVSESFEFVQQIGQTVSNNTVYINIEEAIII